MKEPITIAMYNTAKIDIEAFIGARKNIIEAARIEAQRVFKKILPNWEMVRFHESSFTLGFKYGEHNGYPLYRDLEFYYGHGFCGDKFKFEMNTSCFGSFTILDGKDDNDSIREYFKAVGIVLTATEEMNELEIILKEFDKTFTRINSDIWSTKQIISDYENEQKRIAKDAEEAALYENQLQEILAGAEYAIIDKTSEKYNNFTYRKKPVRMIGLPSSDWAELNRTVNNHNCNKYVNKWFLLETAKLLK